MGNTPAATQPPEGSVATPNVAINSQTPETVTRIKSSEDDVEAQEIPHCHVDHTNISDRKARRKLWFATGLCVVFMICEAVGGYLSGSLAIATDASHLLTDVAAFMISLVAISVASRPASKHLPFGWHRAEVLGALVSVLLIWLVTGILVYIALQRIISGDFEIEPTVMLVTSLVAMFANIIMAFTLHQHTHTQGGAKSSEGGAQSSEEGAKSSEGGAQSSEGGAKSSEGGAKSSKGGAKSSKGGAKSSEGGAKSSEEGATSSEEGAKSSKGGAKSSEGGAKSSKGGAKSSKGGAKSIEGDAETENINVRAAYIHVLGDFIQSVGVLIGAVIIFFKPAWILVDPILTLIFAALVLITTFVIMRDIMLVLMEATPPGFDSNAVVETLLEVEGVVKVHNLRVWAISMHKITLSAHIAVAPGTNKSAVLDESLHRLGAKFAFHEVTLQVEDFNESMDSCKQCLSPT